MLCTIHDFVTTFFWGFLGGFVTAGLVAGVLYYLNKK